MAQTEMRTYETICLTKVDMPQDKLKAMLDRCKKAVTENGKGEWLYDDDWGKAKVAYLIQKEPRAQWNYFRFKSEAPGVDELVRSLKINEFVLRQQTVRTREDGSDYNSFRATFAKDLNDRDKPREFVRDNRRSRGPRGEGGGRYEKSFDRNDDRGAAPASDSAQSEGNEGEKS